MRELPALKRISFYRSQSLDAHANQALEAYFFNTVQEDELIVYLWQNDRTVFIGRNQDAAKECNLEAMQEDGVVLSRRYSGGGAVYHEQANLNFTFCAHEANYDLERQLLVIVKALESLGLKAEYTGRNDIVIDGAKFSGNAFYKKDKRRFHHGTILLNVNPENMQHYLRPSKKKLASKGVDSVRARVLNLCSLLPELDADLLTEKLKAATTKVYALDLKELRDSDLDHKELKRLEDEFSDHEWCFGKAVGWDLSVQERFSWGEIELRFSEESFKLRELLTDALEEEGVDKIYALIKAFESKATNTAGSAVEYLSELAVFMLEELKAESDQDPENLGSRQAHELAVYLQGLEQEQLVYRNH